MSYKEPKHAMEIHLFFVQNGNTPHNIRQVALALDIDYSQTRSVIHRGVTNNRFKKVASPAKGAGTWYISALKSIKEIEDIYDVQIQREERGETSLLVIKRGKVESTDITPLKKNISIDGNDVFKWMGSLAEYPESANKARINAMAFANILAELADIMANAGGGKDAPLKTQLRLDHAYDKLREKIEYLESALARLHQLKDNPIIWSQDFCRRSAFEMLDVKITPGVLREYADQMWDNYGRLKDDQ
jgi:hypothetical protein